ncbi:MAG: hypothetical protein AABZ67_05555 [Pseudomonadota bacterium]
MNRHRIEGSWRQFKGRIREHRGKFADDHFEMIGSKYDPLVGSIQESYGITEDEAEQLLAQSISH